MDEYLAPLPADQRAALERLRRIVRSAAPGVVECIRYGIPTFLHEGRALVHLGAAKHHCALYPGSVIDAFARDLRGLDTGRGTIRFLPGAPLPAALVRRIVRARIAQNREIAARRAAPKSAPGRRPRTRR